METLPSGCLEEINYVKGSTMVVIAIEIWKICFEKSGHYCHLIISWLMRSRSISINQALSTAGGYYDGLIKAGEINTQVTVLKRRQCDKINGLSETPTLQPKFHYLTIFPHKIFEPQKNWWSIKKWFPVFHILQHFHKMNLLVPNIARIENTLPVTLCSWVPACKNCCYLIVRNVINFSKATNSDWKVCIDRKALFTISKAGH